MKRLLLALLCIVPLFGHANICPSYKVVAEMFWSSDEIERQSADGMLGAVHEGQDYWLGWRWKDKEMYQGPMVLTINYSKNHTHVFLRQSGYNSGYNPIFILLLDADRKEIYRMELSRVKSEGKSSDSYYSRYRVPRAITAKMLYFDVIAPY